MPIKLCRNPRSNAFVARFNEAGSKIDWFTYYGGRDDDVASAVAIDTAGNVLIGGSTYSDNLPMTARAIQAAKKGDTDAFLVRLSGTGSDLLSATYLGSSNSGSGVLESVNSNRRRRERRRQHHRHHDRRGTSRLCVRSSPTAESRMRSWLAWLPIFRASYTARILAARTSTQGSVWRWT
ncbi:MAG: SBBP repeat-containing protein [Acidobacteriota bacterium]